MVEISERINFGYDIPQIVSELKPILDSYSPAIRSQAMAGWAIQSTDGSHLDGWGFDFCPFNGPGNCGPTWTPQNEQEEKLKDVQKYTQPTQILTPSIRQIIASLEEKGFCPRKARIIRLSPKSSSVWHQDGSSKFYQVRLHIPLITNSECFFETQQGRVHMEADGAGYLVHINRQHRVYNQGEQYRFHFVCHVWDTKHLSKEHCYSQLDNLGETIHPS